MQADNEVQPATAIEAALDAGCAMATIEEAMTHEGSVPLALVPNGMKLDRLFDVVKFNDDRADARGEAPRRQRGTATLTELDSFIAHVNRHKDLESVVFADAANVKLTAVLNYNEKGQSRPRWGDLRAVYSCPLSEPWRFWNAAAAKKWKQEDFAQLIEERMDDLASPTGNGADKDLPAPNEVLTMARSLEINTSGTFQRHIDPQTGNYTLINKMENTQGTTKIPRAFLLKLQVFEAGDFWPVEARIRFDLNGGVPLFSFFLYQAEEIKRHAFDEVRTKVKQQTELLLLAGSPEQ